MKQFNEKKLINSFAVWEVIKINYILIIKIGYYFLNGLNIGFKQKL
ncbi:hypothetical protein MCAV_03840 [[Mycoplasma] cavipharyngis]